VVCSCRRLFLKNPQALTAAQRREEESAREAAFFGDNEDENYTGDNNSGGLADVLAGVSRADISHAGENLSAQQVAEREAQDEQRAWEDLQDSHK
jgi:hypothetical protein